MDCIRCNNTRTIMYGPHPYQCTNCIGPTYAGIGSRETPLYITQQMTQIAMQLCIRGWVLRSGKGKRPAKPKPDTDSADLAFERGVDLINQRQKIIRVNTGQISAHEHAAQFHPNWDACNDYAKSLHARNSLILLGDWLDNPVKFVLCWTEDGLIKGGTGQGIRIANAMGIPVFNLAVHTVEQFWEWMK